VDFDIIAVSAACGTREKGHTMKALYFWSVIVLGATTADGSILYSQAPDSEPIGSAGGITSYDPLQNAADDFTPNADWIVTGATFRGVWRTGTDADPTTPSRQFEFNFYADNNGPVDPPIFSVTANASLNLAYIYHSSNTDLSVYDLTVDFPSSIQFSGGTKYWFSPVDDGLGRNGANGFFWSNSPEGNKLVTLKDQNGWNLYQQDQVFSIVGTVVPEPSALLMFGTVLMAFGAIAYKRMAAIHQV
jgi:hypothetical protein